MSLEIKNIIKLVKLKLYNERKTYILLTCVMGALYILKMFANLYANYQSDNANNGILLITNYNLYVIFFTALVVALKKSLYETDCIFNVYPQNNNTRYISNKVVSFFEITLVTVIYMILYLLSYIIMGIVSLFDKSIIFAYDFSIAYTIIGFFTTLLAGYLVYDIQMFLIIVIRKIHYFFYPICAIVGFLIIKSRCYLDIYEYVKSYFCETNIAIYFIKVLLVIIICEIISFFINMYTNYFDSSINYNSSIYKTGLIASISILVIIIFIGMITFDDDILSEDENMNKCDNTYSSTVEIDISSVDKKNFNISFTNINDFPNGTNIEGVMELNSNSGNQNHIDNYERLSDNDKYYKQIIKRIISSGNDILTINYEPPYIDENGIISNYSDSWITAELKGDTVYITYVDNKKIRVGIETWKSIVPFDTFKGLNLGDRIEQSGCSGSGSVSFN